MAQFIYLQEEEVVIGNDKLEEQREIGSQADRRRLEFVEQEAELAQEHGRDLTEDAIDSTYSEYNLKLIYRLIVKF